MACERPQHSADEQLLKDVAREYTDYKPCLMSVMLRWTKDIDEAENLYQETWLRIQKNLHTFTPNTHFTSWVLKIARNAFLDTVRYKNAKRRTDAVEVPTDKFFYFPDKRHSKSVHEEALLRQELEEWLQEVMPELLQNSLFTREAMELFLSGEKLPRIAEEIGVTYKALYRHLKKFRIRFADAAQRKGILDYKFPDI